MRQLIFSTHKCILLFTSLLLLGISSCKKNSGDAVPPDTLSAGWTRQNPFNNSNFTTGGGDIFFIDANTGYIASGAAGIYKSTNGGDDWQQVSSFNASNLAMTPDKKLFAVGSNSSIYRLTDGNSTPEIKSLNGSQSIDVFFSNNGTGLCTTKGGLYLTDDGGNNWDSISNLPSLDSSVSISSIAIAGSNAWVVYSYFILHSNGSNFTNWHLDSITIQDPRIGIYGVSAPTPDIVYVISRTGYVCKSTDGGNTFNQVYKAEGVANKDLSSDIHFVSAAIGFISVGKVIYKTTDGGTSWNVVVSLGTSDILEIHFVDENHGWALCYDGSILKLN